MKRGRMFNSLEKVLLVDQCTAGVVLFAEPETLQNLCCTCWSVYWAVEKSCRRLAIEAADERLSEVEQILSKLRGSARKTQPLPSFELYIRYVRAIRDVEYGGSMPWRLRLQRARAPRPRIDSGKLPKNFDWGPENGSAKKGWCDVFGVNQKSQNDFLKTVGTSRIVAFAGSSSMYEFEISEEIFQDMRDRYPHIEPEYRCGEIEVHNGSTEEVRHLSVASHWEAVTDRLLSPICCGSRGRVSLQLEVCAKLNGWTLKVDWTGASIEFQDRIAFASKASFRDVLDVLLHSPYIAPGQGQMFSVFCEQLGGHEVVLLPTTSDSSQIKVSRLTLHAKEFVAGQGRREKSLSYRSGEPFILVTSTSEQENYLSTLILFSGFSNTAAVATLESIRPLLGKYLAPQAQIWQQNSAPAKALRLAGLSSVKAVAVSKDIAVTVSNCSDAVLIWDLESHSVKNYLRGHHDCVNTVSIYAEVVVTGSDDGTVHVWDWRSGVGFLRLEGHKAAISSIEICAEYIVSGSWDRTVRVWLWSIGKCICVFRGHGDGVTAVSIGESFVVSAANDASLFAWRMTDGTEICSFKGHCLPVRSISISGQIIATGSDDKTIRLWEFGTGQCLHVLLHHTAAVNSVCFANGHTLLSGSNDSTVVEWDLTHDQVLPSQAWRHIKGVVSLATCEDYAISGSWDGTAHLRDSKTWSLLEVFEVASENKAFQEHDDRLVSGKWGSCIGNPNGGPSCSLCLLEGHTSAVRALVLSGNTLASGSADRTVRIWHVESGICSTVFSGNQASVSAVAFDDRFVASGAENGQTMVWDRKSGSLVAKFAWHSDEVVCMALENSVLVTGSSDSTICIVRLFDFHTSTILKAHSKGILSLSLHGNVLVSSSDDLTIRVWDFHKGKCLLQMEVALKMTSVAVDGRGIVSGCVDGSIMMWDTSTGYHIRTLEGHSERVLKIDLADNYIISASADQTVKIWDRWAGRCVKVMKESYVQMLSFTSQYPSLAVSGLSDGSIHLQLLNTQSTESIKAPVLALSDLGSTCLRKILEYIVKSPEDVLLLQALCECSKWVYWEVESFCKDSIVSAVNKRRIECGKLVAKLGLFDQSLFHFYEEYLTSIEASSDSAEIPWRFRLQRAMAPRPTIIDDRIDAFDWGSVLAPPRKGWCDLLGSNHGALNDFIFEQDGKQMALLAGTTKVVEIPPPSAGFQTIKQEFLAGIVPVTVSTSASGWQPFTKLRDEKDLFLKHIEADHADDFKRLMALTGLRLTLFERWTPISVEIPTRNKSPSDASTVAYAAFGGLDAMLNALQRSPFIASGPGDFLAPLSVKSQRTANNCSNGLERYTISLLANTKSTNYNPQPIGIAAMLELFVLCLTADRSVSVFRILGIDEGAETILNGLRITLFEGLSPVFLRSQLQNLKISAIQVEIENFQHHSQPIGSLEDGRTRSPSPSQSVLSPADCSYADLDAQVSSQFFVQLKEAKDHDLLEFLDHTTTEAIIGDGNVPSWECILTFRIAGESSNRTVSHIGKRKNVALYAAAKEVWEKFGSVIRKQGAPYFTSPTSSSSSVPAKVPADPISSLKILADQTVAAPPVYRVVESVDGRFTMEVQYKGLQAVGKPSRGKQAAKRSAAQEMLNQLSYANFK